MNKNTTKIIAFIVGIIIGVIALFEVIGVITSTVSFINSVIEAAKEDIKLGTNFYIYQPINILLAIAVVCLYGILSYKMIKAYVKKEEDNLNRPIMPIFIFFAFGAVSDLLYLIFSGFEASNFVYLILNVAGVTLLVLAIFVKTLAKNVKNILLLVAVGIAFILSVIYLAGSGSLGILINLLEVSMAVLVFLYYLFNMIINGDFKEKAIESNSTEDKPVEEETKDTEEEQKTEE